MGLFGSDLFGSRRAAAADSSGSTNTTADDEQAIARYRYLLKTAPPEAIEQAHAEAFAQLTPEQRRVVLQQLAEVTPPAEKPVLERSPDDPQVLARAATRAEVRQPGVMERVFGRGAAAPAPAPGVAAGPGFGGMMAGSLLGSVAGTVLGSVIAREFFTQHADAWSGVGHDVAPAGGEAHRFATADNGLAPGADPFHDGSDGGDPDPGIAADYDSGFDDGPFDV